MFRAAGRNLMPLSRTYPDYGSPGAPNTDPYYLSPAEERELEAERESARRQIERRKVYLAKLDRMIEAMK